MCFGGWLFLIPAFGLLWLEDFQPGLQSIFQDSQGYTDKPFIKKKKKKKKKQKTKNKKQNKNKAKKIYQVRNLNVMQQ